MRDLVDPVAATQLRIRTPACPTSVWAALTCPETTPRWLYGTALSSTWRAGDGVVGRLAGALEGCRLEGQVLRAEPPYRLSYTFEDGGCATYVTWEMAPAGPASAETLVTLTVDGDGDVTAVWRPALAALAAVLTA